MPALVNNAGITKALLQTLHTFRERDWPRTAKVIPVSSTFGLVGWPWQWSDHVPKFADVGMSEPPSKKLHSPGTPRLRHAPGRCTNAKPWRRLNCNWFPPCKVPEMPHPIIFRMESRISAPSQTGGEDGFEPRGRRVHGVRNNPPGKPFVQASTRHRRLRYAFSPIHVVVQPDTRPSFV